MKRFPSFLFALCLTAIAPSALASPLKPHTFLITPELSYINYEEPRVMEEEGIMYGLGAAYTYRGNFMLRFDGRFAYGKVDYDSRNTGSLDNITDYIIELRGIFGKDIPITPSTTLTPYTGLAYRYLNDDTGGMVTTTGHYGYERESNYLYMPLGVETLADLTNGWFAGIVFEYDIFFAGEQVSHLSDVNPGFGDVRNDQDKGYGLRGSLQIRREGAPFNLLLEPFIRYWNIEDSEIAPLIFGGAVWGYGLEPENKSTEIGLKAGIWF